MLPIVPHTPLVTDRRTRRFVSDYASRLKSQPEFRRDALLSQLTVSRIEDAPSVVLDDFTDVLFFTTESLMQEQRARLRASAGDIVVTLTPVDFAFDQYVADDLGLGDVRWLSAVADPGSIALAQACWCDRALRRELVHAVRVDGLQYVHPHLGNRDVWRMAQLISCTAHRPLKVIAPPPAVSRWANDKVAFARVVTDLLGHEFVPQTKVAYGFAFLTQRVHELAQTSRFLGLKVPHSAGGEGNLFLDAAPLRTMELRELNDHLRALIPSHRWPPNVPMLVDVWETHVMENASIQTWIPPLAVGDPIIEGIFAQIISGQHGRFVGCQPLSLPKDVYRTVVTATSTLTLLYQQMGYVGRCSFDFLLVGTDWEKPQVEFLECNGRWGGTSIPMTLVNRLFGDWKEHPFASVSMQEILPRETTFSNVLKALGPDLFRRPTDGQSSGWLIPFNPRALQTCGGLHCIVLGQDVAQVRKRVARDLPARLSSLDLATSAERAVCANPHTPRNSLGPCSAD